MKSSVQSKTRTANIIRRARILFLHAGGCTSNAIAERLGVSHAAICKILKSEGKRSNLPFEGDYEGGPCY